MIDPRLSQLKHDLANPLSAVLAETQLLLIGGHDLTEEVAKSLRAIETAALRMRAMLKALNTD